MSSSEYETRYAKLNAAQRQAVDILEGPVLVIAGPGTGKTELIGVRVAHILKNTDTPASSILCLTFTDSAAYAMRQRLTALIGQAAHEVHIHTFHGFAATILHRFPDQLSKGVTKQPIDELLQLSFIEQAIQALPGSSILRSRGGEGAFVYASSILKSIETIKKAGLTPEEFHEHLTHYQAAITEEQKHLAGPLGERISAKMAGSLLEALSGVTHYLSQEMVEELASYCELAQDGSTAPLREWKTKHTTKDEQGATSLSAFEALEKLQQLSQVYASYQKQLTTHDASDFTDLLLSVTHALNLHEGVKSELQEQFLYVHVDEFQDTNPVQMQLLQHLTDHPIHEGRPNILAVGDDDQSIYRFQGAEVENILQFTSLYREVTTIVLTETYRSKQEVLDVAKQVIELAGRRITTLNPEIAKPLRSALSGVGTISYHQHSFASGEHQWLAQEVGERIAAGTPAEEIAVICRTHRQLQEVTAALQAASIPVSYEREQQVLTNPAVAQLMQITSFCLSFAKGEVSSANQQVVSILQLPLFALDRQVLWKFITTKPAETDWITHALTADPSISTVISWLTDSASLSLLIPQRNWIAHLLSEGSPAFTHTIGPEARSHQAQQVIDAISSLEQLLTITEAHFPNRLVTGQELSDLFKQLLKREQNLTTTSPRFAHGVQLLTAHKAKGLEFHTVFIPSCTQEVWGAASRGQRVILPRTLLGLLPSDHPDDALRLLFVAITRAKQELIISWHEKDATLRERLPYSPIVQNQLQETVIHQADSEQTLTQLIAQATLPFTLPLSRSEQELLAPKVENLQLSATMLITFFNLTHGGPQKFLQRYLLNLPEPQTEASLYGTLVHESLRWYWLQKAQGTQPALEYFIQHALDQVEKLPLPAVDRAALAERLPKEFSRYYEHKGKEERPNDRLEYRPSQAQIDGIRLSGSIDRLSTKGGSLIVSDTKTSKTIISTAATGNKDHKIRVWQYQRQLEFYAVLAELSRENVGKTVQEGRIEYFLSPQAKDDLIIAITPEAKARMKQLICALHRRLNAWDLPSELPATLDLESILALEQDTLDRFSS